MKQIPAADLPDIIGSQLFENILRRCRPAVAVHKTVSVAGLLLVKVCNVNGTPLGIGIVMIDNTLNTAVNIPTVAIVFVEIFIISSFYPPLFYVDIFFKDNVISFASNCQPFYLL